MAVASARLHQTYGAEGFDITPSKLSFKDSVALSSMLSKQRIGVWKRIDGCRVIPTDIIPMLKAQEVDMMLVGAYGASYWMLQPRATQDVDFLIPEKAKGKAAKAVLAKFPNLTLEKHAFVWRFSSNGNYVLDLILTNTIFLKRVFQEFEWGHVSRYKIKYPKIEAALAMKFAAMTSPTRKQHRSAYDAADFGSIVESGKQIDLSLLQAIAELVYPGAGKEAVDYVAKVRSGQRLVI